jgi:hypothetical protein
MRQTLLSLLDNRAGHAEERAIAHRRGLNIISQPFEHRQPATGDQLMNRARRVFANARQIPQSFDCLLLDDFIHRAITVS